MRSQAERKIEGGGGKKKKERERGRKQKKKKEKLGSSGFYQREDNLKL